MKRIKHISDCGLDGVACTALTELIVDNYPHIPSAGISMFEVDIENIHPSRLYGCIRKAINEIERYSLIIITDLVINKGIADLIENSGYKERFLVFDHHPSDINPDNYSWYHNRIEQEHSQPITKCSSINLYVDYLKRDPVFDIHIIGYTESALSYFIKTVEYYDIGCTEDEMPIPPGVICPQNEAHRLNTLFHLIPYAMFRDRMKSFIQSTSQKEICSLTELGTGSWLDIMINTEIERNRKYVEASLLKLQIVKVKDMLINYNGRIEELNATFGIVFAEKMGPMIGSAVCDRKKNVDICAVITNNQVSLYTKKPEIDLRKIAQLFGGGGNAKAAGFSVDYDDAARLNRAHFLGLLKVGANITQGE